MTKSDAMWQSSNSWRRRSPPSSSHEEVEEGSKPYQRYTTSYYCSFYPFVNFSPCQVCILRHWSRKIVIVCVVVVVPGTHDLSERNLPLINLSLIPKFNTSTCTRYLLLIEYCVWENTGKVHKTSRNL